MVFAGLILVFMAVPNVSYGFSAGSSSVRTEYSGFDYYESGTDFFKSMLIITGIVACVLTVVALLKTLIDCFSKKKKFSGLLTFILKIAGLTLFVTALLYMISVIVMCSDNSITNDYSSIGLSPVYWSIVLIAIFGLISAVSAFLTNKAKKKK